MKASDRLAMEISRIRTLSNLDMKSLPSYPDTPLTSASLPRQSREASDELERMEGVIMELIDQFQEYRTSVESRLVSFRLEQEQKIEEIVSMKVKSAEAQLRETVERDLVPLMKPPDILRLREDLARLKEDHVRLTEKVRRVNQMNCESHLRSSDAMKSLRKVLINR